MKRVRGGGEVSGEEVLKFAKLFKDDFTIMNLSRTQLSSICKFLNLRPYGTDAFMRWQISRRYAPTHLKSPPPTRTHTYHPSHRVSKLREDDTMIAEEGVKSLTFEELQQACIARGMPATGLSKVALRYAFLTSTLAYCVHHCPFPSQYLTQLLHNYQHREQLEEWLDSSLNEQLPAVILILSRALSLTTASQVRSPPTLVDLDRMIRT
jgi:LETM1 and EF-hand domain-containing protein 1